MYIKELLRKCEESGHPLTRMGLYAAGKKNGFLVSMGQGNPMKFDKKKFLEWLKKATEKVPEGWVSINQLKDILGISISHCYLLIKRPEVGARTFGGGKGVFYVDPVRAKEIVDRDKAGNISWDEEEGGENEI